VTAALATAVGIGPLCSVTACAFSTHKFERLEEKSHGRAVTQQRKKSCISGSSRMVQRQAGSTVPGWPSGQARQPDRGAGAESGLRWMRVSAVQQQPDDRLRRCRCLARTRKRLWRHGDKPMPSPPTLKVAGATAGNGIRREELAIGVGLPVQALASRRRTPYPLEQLYVLGMPLCLTCQPRWPADFLEAQPLSPATDGALRVH